MSCSSGPIQSTAHWPLAELRHATSEMFKPRAAPAAAITGTRPRRGNRAAGGNSRTPLGRSSGGAWRAVDRSAIEAAPFLVVEHRRSHLNRYVTAGHRYMESLTHSVATSTDHGQRNGAFQDRAVIGRGNVTDGLEGRREAGRWGDLCSFLQHDLRRHARKSHELLSIRGHHGGPHQ